MIAYSVSFMRPRLELGSHSGDPEPRGTREHDHARQGGDPEPPGTLLTLSKVLTKVDTIKSYRQTDRHVTG